MAAKTTKSGAKPMVRKQASGDPVKGGKKSVKQVHQDLGFGDVPNNYDVNKSDLDIDTELAQELQTKGLVHRWINRTRFQKTGFHKNHWKPYKRESRPGGYVSNIDSDGYTIMQDLILAVKPVSWNDAHRQYLKNKVERQTNVQKRQAEEFKQFSEKSGLKTEIDTGYGEDDSDED